MPQGHWSSLMKGGSSANALTQDGLTDMGDGAALQETRVEVVKIVERIYQQFECGLAEQMLQFMFTMAFEEQILD